MPRSTLPDYAIVIGIDRYRYPHHLPDLEGAQRDAQRFRDWLIDHAAVKEENILPPIGRVFREREEPRLEFLCDQFGELLDRFERNDRRPIGRRLYVFLAGHGGNAASRSRARTTLRGGPYFFSVASRPGQSALLAAVEYADNLFLEQGVFEEVLLFMDCCRDHFHWAGEARPQHEAGRTTARRPSRKFHAFATSGGAKAREIRYRDEVRGAFTAALLEGLNGWASRDGRVTSSALRDFLRERVPHLSPNGLRQDPDFDDKVDLTLIEGVRKPTVRVQFRLHAPVRELVVLSGATLERLRTLNPEGDEPVEVELPVWESYVAEVVSGNGTASKPFHTRLAPQEDIVHVHL